MPILIAALAIGLAALLAPAGGSAAGGPKCMGKNATIVRGDGDNEIDGTEGPDVIVAGGGDDSVEAHSGADLVCGGGGNDLIFTGPSNDKVAAGGGRDEVHGVGGKDTLKGDAGDDSGTVPHALHVTIDAGLYGGDKADKLNGGEGDDFCDGEEGSDDLVSCEIGR